MLYYKTSFLAFMAATLVTALPTPVDDVPTPVGLVILEKSNVEHGVLVVYGDVEIHGTDGQKLKNRSLAPANVIEKRQCGSNTLYCNARNYIPSAACTQNLIDSIRRTASNGLQEAPRSICLQSNDGFCCVSWANPVYGGRRGYLINAAQAAHDGCVRNSQSGLTRNTLIGSTCTTQCLSSDANSCTNG